MKGRNYGIFMIHGWGGSIRSLHALAENLKTSLEFEGKHKVFIRLIELPGFGNTPLPSVLNLDEYVLYVQELVRNQLKDWDSSLGGNTRLDEIIYIGHSFGGKILLKMLEENKILEKSFVENSRVVLINASGVKPAIGRKQVIVKGFTSAIRPLKNLFEKIGLVGFVSFLRKIYYKFVVGVRDYEKAYANVNLRKTLQLVLAENIDLNRLSKSTQSNESSLKDINIIWGEADKSTPLWMGKKLNEALKGSTLDIVPGAGHGLPLHMPEIVAKLVIKQI